MTDSHLIAKLKQGDHESFRKIFDQYYPSLIYFAKTMIKNEHIAQDMVIDSFIRLFKNLDRLKDDSNIKAFLYLITRNICLDHIRSERRAAELHKAYKTILPINENLEREIERKQIESFLLKTIYNELRNVPAASREIFIMTYFENLDAREIMKRLSISQTAVTSHRYKAIKILRERLRNLKW